MSKQQTTTDPSDELEQARQAELDAQDDAERAEAEAQRIEAAIEAGDTAIGADELTSSRSLRDYWSHRKVAAQRRREAAEAAAREAAVQQLVSDVQAARDGLRGSGELYDAAVRALEALRAALAAHDSTVGALRARATALGLRDATEGRLSVDADRNVLLDGRPLPSVPWHAAMTEATNQATEGRPHSYSAGGSVRELLA